MGLSGPASQVYVRANTGAIIMLLQLQGAESCQAAGQFLISEAGLLCVRMKHLLR